MPRRRATKAKPANIPKPKGAGKSSLTENEENEKKEKLEIFLKEFDSQVNTYRKSMEKKKRAATVTISQRYNRFLAALESDLKNMTIKEFISAGGTFESAEAHFIDKSNLKSVNKNMDKVTELQNLLCAGPRVLDRVMEEDCEETGGQTIEPKTEAIPRTRKALKTMMVPPSTSSRRSKRAVNTTPLHKIEKMEWGQTPLITPKFDPKLPFTPENIRKMRPGERLMSIAGSPVECDPTDNTRTDKDIAMTDFMSITPRRMEKMIKMYYESSRFNK